MQDEHIQCSLLVNAYNDIGSRMDEIISDGIGELICLDLCLSDSELLNEDDDTPVQSIMKISILIDQANEFADFVRVIWGRLLIFFTVDLLPIDTVSLIASYVEPPLLEKGELPYFNELFQGIVAQMEN